MKYLAFILMFVSSSVLANVPVNNVSNNTILTKDSLIVLDKRAGKFWKINTGCTLPLTESSSVKFTSSSRIMRKGTKVTFTIDKDKHTCSIEKITTLS